MNSKSLLVSIVPMGLFVSSGMASDTFTFKEHWLAANLTVLTYYNCPVDGENSTTAAAASASTFGENCWEFDSDEYVSDSGFGGPSASASVSSVLFSGINNPLSRTRQVLCHSGCKMVV